MATRVLAFDFGASSGRAILCTLEDGALRFCEVHRFDNDPVSVGGTLYWDVLRLFHELKQGMVKAKQQGGFDAIGIDTWGVDFGLIDKHGDLIGNPVHYRDARTKGIAPQVWAQLPKAELYRRTGIQYLHFNTLYQLYYLSHQRPDLLERTDKILMIPDLFAYLLTGQQRAEATFASTTNLLNPTTRQWDGELLQAIGISPEVLCPILQPGQEYGRLSQTIADELGVDSVPVIAVATHDTASAVAAVPTQEQDFVYISCGTWSLFGTELASPLLTQQAEQANFTNEGGVCGTIRFLKNIMGLWLFQECCRQWKREGAAFTYRELDDRAEAAPAFASLIDPDAPEFEAPGNMPERIRDFCRRTGQRVPLTDGEIVRCIYESLALKYRYTLHTMTGLTQTRPACIHMVGGGIKAELLCQFTADACGLPVVAGPVEATVAGNAAVQLMALGQIETLTEARSIIQGSTHLARYTPCNRDSWDNAYQTFLQYLS